MAYELVSGSQAAAIAVQRVGVDMVAAYPITPQTAIVETLANFDAKGELGAEFVSVESEYAALACCNGAASAGARVFTATASHGLAYMHEMIHWCGGARVPLVMVNVNRSIGAPWCLDPDQGDSLSQRDTGWLQLYCASGQEVFDTVVQAFALSEELLLPCMVVFDGFYISHTYEVVDIPDKELVARFIGRPDFTPHVLPGAPGNIHGIIPGEYQMQLVKKQHAAMLRAPAVYAELNERYSNIFGRSYRVCEDTVPAGAKKVFFTAGAMAETVKFSLTELEGTGLLQLRMLRPFPAREIREIIEKEGIEEVIVLDRNCSRGMGGIFAQELKNALYSMDKRPLVHNLSLAGGIDLTGDMLRAMLEHLEQGAGETMVWGDEI